MALNERQQKMLAHLQKKGCDSVKRLASIFFVSEMTVRRDLNEMEKSGYVQRYNGGASCLREDRLPIAMRKNLHEKSKKMLSERICGYLSDGMSVFIDSSSTSLYIIPFIAEKKGVKIFTNSAVCLRVAAKYHIPCTMAGGDYYEPDMCTIGPFAERFLREINVDIAFFSAMGVCDNVVTDDNEKQTAVRIAVMENSKKNVFLMDNSKVDKKFLYTVPYPEDNTEIIVL